MMKFAIVCALWMAGGVWPVTAAPPDLAWKQTPTSLTLLSGETTVWQFNYEKGDGKPFFHPVTVAGSPSLTDLRPADHPWHLALWFSWKFINGVNYWEFDRKTGKTAGTTEVLDVNVAPGTDHGARFRLKLAYHPPGKPPLLTEDREIVVSPPTPAGQWHIDWQSTFTAGTEDVRLDRTPIAGEPQGKPYGGYAGLSLRLAPALRDWSFTGAEGPVTANNAQSRWMAFSGPVPGGGAATILVLDHPRSFRHPTSWYLINKMPYFSPAVLYHSSHTLAAGQRMTLKYRIVFQPGPSDRAAAEEEWQQFAAALR